RLLREGFVSVDVLFRHWNNETVDIFACHVHDPVLSYFMHLKGARDRMRCASSASRCQRSCAMSILVICSMARMTPWISLGPCLAPTRIIVFIDSPFVSSKLALSFPRRRLFRLPCSFRQFDFAVSTQQGERVQFPNSDAALPDSYGCSFECRAFFPTFSSLQP